MTDEKLEHLLDDAARTYRVPPEPPLDAMWAQIENEAFGARSRRRRLMLDWRQAGVGIAAALLIGVGVGRVTARRGLVGPAPARVAAVASDDTVTRTPHTLAGPYDRMTSEYLGQTAALLASLPSATREPRNTQFVSQAADLLSTTRLLLDSPAAQDAEMRSLLSDLELVLAQIARLPARRSIEELDLINEAIRQRDVVPRLHSAVADIYMSDN
jgi:hypothetical protein